MAELAEVLAWLMLVVFLIGVIILTVALIAFGIKAAINLWKDLDEWW
jgi:hypothetical protein